MAEKKQSKGYTAGNGKKFLVGIGVFVLLAIIAVVIILSIPANTNSAMGLLNKATKNSFLMSRSESAKYDELENTISNATPVNDYLKVIPTEMADIQSLSIAIDEVLEYYNDQMLFIQGTKAFKSNFKLVRSNLKNAMESQKQLNILIDNANKLSQQAPTYLQNAWTDIREEYLEWLKYSKDSIVVLSDAYQEGMGNSVYNNIASNAILNTVNDYVEVIYVGFENIVAEENANPNRTEYDYDLQGKIAGFEDFVANYVTNDEDIKECRFNTTIQTKFEKINNYFDLYNEEDMKNAIDSIECISGSPIVTKTYEDVEDTDGVYLAVKLFLMGGM